MAENRSSLISIIALIIGASGLGLGAFSVVNFQVVEGPPGQDGLDGVDGVDNNNTGKHVIEPITYLPAMDSGATLNSIWIELDAIGDYMYATFFANSDVVDTSEDVIFRFIMNCAQTDASLQMLKYGAHTGTDNTTSSIFSWNIDYDVAISFNTTSSVMFIYEYIFDAVNIENDDWLSFALKLNEAARAVGIMYAEVEYIHI